MSFASACVYVFVYLYRRVIKALFANDTDALAHIRAAYNLVNKRNRIADDAFTLAVVELGENGCQDRRIACNEGTTF